MSDTKRRGTRGMGSVYKKRGVYWIQYYHNKERIRESSGSHRKQDATALLKSRLAEIHAGKFVGPQSKKLTFAEMTEDLKADYRNKGNKSWDRVERALKHLQGMFGRDKAHEVTAARIARYASARLGEGAARATVANELAALKRALRVANELGKLQTVPSFPKGFTSTFLKNAREEFIDEWEYNLLLPELPAPARPMVTFVYCTGWRWKSEVRTLRWDQVDEYRCIVVLPGLMTKNGRPRKLPYGDTPELVAVMEEAKRYTQEVEQKTGKPVPWVFHQDGTQWSGNSSGFYKIWKAACRKAGVLGRDGKPKILHDLRRAAVRRFERQGVSREIAKRLVGHETDSMYARYNIVNEDELAGALAKSLGVKPPLSHHQRENKETSTVSEEA